MAMKTTFFLLLLGIPGILEVQAASIAAENEIWKNLDEGLPCSLFFFLSLTNFPSFFRVLLQCFES